MDLGIKDKVALVHGAGSGLGRAIALALASEGVKVGVADRHAERVRETAEQVEATGVDALALEWDLWDIAGIDSHFLNIERVLGDVDILVNNTGGPPPTPAIGQNPELWSDHFRSMVLCVIAITDRALPAMRRRRWGRVITSTSSGVVAPIPHLAISNALRMSLVGWSKTLAGEVGGEGVTANIVVPGRIATGHTVVLVERLAERTGRSVKEVEAESNKDIPIGRYGDPQEYGDVVTFLASERASYVTGSVVRVDGGMISGI
jgi:3-oxoacyl-[acyl-carrier protein] reductase